MHTKIRNWHKPFSYLDGGHRGLRLRQSPAYTVDTLIQWHEFNMSDLTGFKETAEVHFLYCLSNPIIKY